MKTVHVACFLALVLLSLTVVNCGRDEFPDDDGWNQDTTNTDFHYSGSVVVPENYPGDVNDLVIISNTDSVGVWEGDYTVLVNSQVSDFHPLYVTNQFGEIVMMGYNTWQKTSTNITDTSTALGLIMMTPAILSLSEEGKSEMFDNIMNDPNFGNFVYQVRLQIESGNSLFSIDSSSTALMSSLIDVYNSASFKRKTKERVPVEFNRGGKLIYMNNKAKAFHTIAGIYKDDKLVETKEIEGVDIVPKSISDIVFWTGGTLDDPKVHEFVMSGDGVYTFKLRTGLPGSGDGSPEHLEAMVTNIASAGVDILKAIVPTPKKGNPGYDEAEKCWGTALNVIKDLSENSPIIADITGQYALNQKLQAVTKIVQSKYKLILDCSGIKLDFPDNWQSFIKKYAKQMNFFNKAFSIISTTANKTIHLAQWVNTNAVLDTCFEVTGNSVSSVNCGNDPNTFTDPRDNQTYKIVKIGNQTWFAENLAYVPQNGNYWAYDNNQSNVATYGYLYDWNTALTACPSGWHLPTDAEWTILTNYLGGASVAGGKMKSTTGWNAPNVAATNSSGFSGLPGGQHNIGGTFEGIGGNGYWWSSTGDRCKLNYSISSAFTNIDDKRNGFSCRCLRD